LNSRAIVFFQKEKLPGLYSSNLLSKLVHCWSSDDMRVAKAKVVGSEIQVGIGDRYKNGAINNAVRIDLRGDDPSRLCSHGCPTVIGLRHVC